MLITEILWLSGVVCRSVGFAPLSAALSGFFWIFYSRPQSQWGSSRTEPGVWAAQNERLLSPTGWNTQRPDGLFIFQVYLCIIEVFNVCVVLYCCFSIILLLIQNLLQQMFLVLNLCQYSVHFISLFMYAFIQFLISLSASLFAMSCSSIHDILLLCSKYPVSSGDISLTKLHPSRIMQCMCLHFRELLKKNRSISPECPDSSTMLILK